MLKKADFLECRIASRVEIDEWKLVIDEQHAKGGAAVLFPVQVFALSAVTAIGMRPFFSELGSVHFLKGFGPRCYVRSARLPFEVIDDGMRYIERGIAQLLNFHREVCVLEIAGREFLAEAAHALP